MKKLFLLCCVICLCFKSPAQDSPLLKLTLHSTVDTIYRVLDSTMLRHYYKVGDSMVYIVIENVSAEPVTVPDDFYVAYKGDPAPMHFDTWYAEGDSFRNYNYHNWDIGFMPDVFDPDPKRVLQVREQVVVYRPVFSMHGYKANTLCRAQVIYYTAVNGKPLKLNSNYIHVYFSGVADTLDRLEMDQLLKTADAAEQTDDYYRAIELYRELCTRKEPGAKMNEWMATPLHSRYYEWQYKIALCAMKLERYSAAWWALLFIPKDNIGYLKYHALLAEAYYKDARYADAAKAYERVAAKSGATGTLNADYVRMAELSREKDYEALMNDPRRLADTAGKYADARDPYRAIELYERAERLDPDGFRDWRDKVKCYMALGRLNDALNDATKAIEKRPESSYYHIVRAEVYIAKGRTKDACNDLEWAERNDAEGYFKEEIDEMKKKHCGMK